MPYIKIRKKTYLEEYQTPTSTLFPFFLLLFHISAIDSISLHQTTKAEVKHIRILKTWGIRSVEIVTADQKIEEELTTNISAEQLTEAKDKVDMLFKNANRDHPVIKELIAFATQRLARKLGTKTNGH